ncbi:hypothetical protein Tco_0327538 [Tanacetum coccineum]
MSTTSVHQQSLADAGSETRPPTLEKGSYIPWASRFRHYLNRKRETRKFLNRSIDKGPYEARESLVSVYSRFSQLINDLKRNKIELPNQYEKLVIASRAKKAAKTHDPLALVANTSSSSFRSSPPYYVTHPLYMVDYDDDYQGDTFSDGQEDSLTSAMMLLARAITQLKMLGMVEELQGGHTILKRSLLRVVIAKGHYAWDCPKLRVRDSKYFMEQILFVKKDEVGVILSYEQNDFLLADAAQMEEIEELSANICMMARIQQATTDSDEGPNYDSAFISEVQTPSTSFMNSLFSNSNHEQTYHEQSKIVNSTNDYQINSDTIFDDPNVEINDGNVKHDKNAHGQHDNKLELLARNGYKEAEKQLILAKKVKQQNVELTKQIEQYKEWVRVFETTKANKTNFHKEYIEADHRAR